MKMNADHPAARWTRRAGLVLAVLLLSGAQVWAAPSVGVSLPPPSLFTPVKKEQNEALDKAQDVLDAQIQAATIAAHHILTLDRMENFLRDYVALYPQRQKFVTTMSARWAFDRQAALGVYITLLRQIATSPISWAVPARAQHIQQDWSDRGQTQFQAYLSLLVSEVSQMKQGTPASPEEILVAIRAIPSQNNRP